MFGFHREHANIDANKKGAKNGGKLRYFEMFALFAVFAVIFQLAGAGGWRVDRPAKSGA